MASSPVEKHFQMQGTGGSEPEMDEEETYAAQPAWGEESDASQESDEAEEEEERLALQRQEEEKDLALKRLYMQFGARRHYQLRSWHHLHKARCGMKVADGEELGNLVASRSTRTWSNLSYQNVEIVGGVPLQGGEKQLAPYVRFIPPAEAPPTDDKDWLRPIDPKIMQHMQPKWLESINSRFQDEDKRKRVLDYYKPVLEWSPSQLQGKNRLDPVAMGTGERGFRYLDEKEKKLKSIMVKPPVQARKPPAESGEAPEEQLRKKPKGGSSVDTESVQDDCPFESLGPGSRVWRLGQVGRVQTFNGIDGCVYAALLPA